MHETTRPEPGRFYRWLVLIFVSLAMFGSYYAYDALSPIADILKQQLGFTDLDIGFLQAIYSFPNIFTVLVGGFIIDRIGLRKSLMIFGVLCFIGPAITAASGHLSVMASGRLLFGMGAESLNVAVTTALARWFRGKELSFAFGLNLTASRLGTFAALNSPTWARWAYHSWRPAFLISLAFSALCIVGAAVYWAMEVYAEKNYRPQLYTLAAFCLAASAEGLNRSLTTKIERRLKEITPPRDMLEAEALAKAGKLVVPHLRMRYHYSRKVAASCIRAIAPSCRAVVSIIQSGGSGLRLIASRRKPTSACLN